MFLAPRKAQVLSERRIARTVLQLNTFFQFRPSLPTLFTFQDCQNLGLHYIFMVYAVKYKRSVWSKISHDYSQ